MLARYSRKGGAADARFSSAAVGASILAHGFLVLGAVRLYHPARQPPAAPRPISEVAYFDLPPLPPALAQPAPAAPTTSGRAPESASRPGVVPRRAAPLEVSPLPIPPVTPAPAASEAAPPAGDAARPVLQGGYLDPRLHAGPLPAPPSVPPVRRPPVDSARIRRSIVVFGRAIPAPDTAAARGDGLRLNLSGEWIVMPDDGRAWRDFQLKQQQEATERDSLLRERARATRERNGRRNP